MCVMVEPKLKNTGSSEFTAYDATSKVQQQSTLKSTKPANNV